MSAPIHFNGTDYDSVEAMPPHIRRAYERSQRDKARHQPGQDDDEEDDEAEEDSKEDGDDEEHFKPAWGGAQRDGSVAVPAGFESVTSLGPAAAVHEYDWTSILPTFGTPRAHVLVRYRDGFAFRTGKDVHTWRWDEVADIQSNLSRSATNSVGLYSTTHEYTLAKLNGDKVILDDGLKQVENLAQLIKKPVFARMGPPLAKRYKSGETLAFGPVAIHRESGLQLDGKAYAWPDIQNIQVAHGQFKIMLKDGKHHEVRVKAIPNIEMLCQMIGLDLNSTELAY